MRTGLVSLLALLVTAPALPQQVTPPAEVQPTVVRPAEVRPAEPALPPSYGASLRIAAAFVPEGKGVPDVIKAVSTKLPTQYVGILDAAPQTAKLNPEEKKKLEAYKASAPAVVEEVIILVLPMARRAMAAEIAPHFTAEEAEGIADFFESSDGVAFLRPIMGNVAETRVSGQDVDPQEAGLKAALSMPADQVMKLSAFIRTPSGQAFKREGAVFDQLAARSMTKVISAPLSARIHIDACRKISPSYC